MHIYRFTTVLREAVLAYFKITYNKWIKDDIASIDVAWESIAHKTHDHGHPISTIR